MTIAFTFTGYSLSRIVFTPVLGRWSDSKNRTNFIIAGLIIYSLVSISYLSLPRNVAFLIFLRFIQGIGAALVRPIALAFIGDISEKHYEGTHMGTFDVSFYAGLAVGPIIGGFVNDRFGYRGIFLALLILSLSALIVAAAALSYGHVPPKERKTSKRDYNLVVQNHTLLGLFCFIFTRAFGIALVGIFLPILMHGELKLSSLQIGLVIASGSVLTSLFLRPLGKICDRADRRLLVSFGGMMCGLITISLPFGGGFWQLLILTGMIGFFGALSLPASSALLVEEGNRHGMGLTMGLFNSMMDSGFLVAPLLGGFIMDTLSLSLVFYIAGSIGVAGVICFYLLCRPPARKR